MGSPVNTPYDEEAPFIHPDGITLFFSSKGHKSIGGHDIFFTSLMDNGTWTPPINIGYPINTSGDEYFFVTSPDGQRAYYSSSMGGGLGGNDIYIIDLNLEVETPLTVFEGIIQSSATLKPEHVKINVSNLTSGKLIGTYKPNPSNGRYILILEPGYDYQVEYFVNEIIFHTKNLSVPEKTNYFKIRKTIELEQITFME